MRTLLRSLSVVALALVASCKSKGDPIATELIDTPVYTRVGMHFDTKRGQFLMYSTNYIDMAHYVPPGTKMTLRKVSSRGFELTDDDGSNYVISYVPKHSMVTLAEWREQHFSEQPVEMPEGLSADEKDAIEHGEVRKGMTRRAVFLALGYPPKSNNPSLQSPVLKYEWRRFVSRSIGFDDQDQVDRIGLR